jgi:hypothetical protein
MNGPGFPAALALLVQAVQTNCHIADARHAADLTLCTYLLQMREFFRWEQCLPLGANLPREAIGTWIAERETLWQELEEAELLTLPAAGFRHGLDPFDVSTINQQLQAHGLVYGAGLVGQDRPVFFIAQLQARFEREGLQVLHLGQEQARCLLAPPAVLARVDDQPTVLLRRESLARWCWEKFEAFSLRPHEGTAMHAAVQAYGLDRGFEQALPRWLDEQAEVMLLHEIGERKAGDWLGPSWAAMRLNLTSRRADLYARAVRDHQADLETTLPTLLARDAQASLHMWFANFDGLREQLFPGLKRAYLAWRQGDGGAELRVACGMGLEHFRALARGALDLHAELGHEASGPIEVLWQAQAAVCRA